MFRATACASLVRALALAQLPTHDAASNSFYVKDNLHVSSDRSPRWGYLRRVTSLAVAFCVASGPLEALIPDMHDGDSQPTIVTTADAQRISGGELGAVEHESTLPRAVADDFGSTGDPSESSRDSEPEHAVHVDHCSHGHTVALAASTTIRATGAPMRQCCRSADLELVSVNFAPRLRPPIA